MPIKTQVGDDDLILQAVSSGMNVPTITGYGWVSSTPATATITPIGNGSTATLHAVAAGTTNITLTVNQFSGGPLTHVLAVTVWAADAASVAILVQSPTGQAYPNDPAGAGGGGQIPGGGNNPE